MESSVVSTHELAQKHSKLSEKDKKEFLKKYNATLKELPKILTTDPAIRELGVKQGDVVVIERKSRTSGISLFYRGVING